MTGKFILCLGHVGCYLDRFEMMTIVNPFYESKFKISPFRNKKLLFFEFGHVLCLREKVDLDCPGSKGRILLWIEILLRSDHSVKI